MAEKIYQAYHKNKKTLLEPLIAKLSPLMFAVFPEPLTYLISKTIKLNTMFDSWVGH
jgi:hypothetical protein